jgi:hypothetical protein
MSLGMVHSTFDQHFLVFHSNYLHYYKLFDLRKGSLTAQLDIHPADYCIKKHRIPYLEFGCPGKIIAMCKGQIDRVTIYDLEISNKTGYFQLLLKNSVNVSVESYISAESEGAVYSTTHVRGIWYVFAYREENSYKPIQHRIKRMYAYQGCRSLGLWFNLWSDILLNLGFPGLGAIAFMQTCNPVDGLFKKGNNKKTSMQEIDTLFHPRCNDKNTKHFYFNPTDGSFLHFMQRPVTEVDKKTYLTSVQIYRTL